MASFKVRTRKRLGVRLANIRDLMNAYQVFKEFDLLHVRAEPNWRPRTRYRRWSRERFHNWCHALYRFWEKRMHVYTVDRKTGDHRPRQLIVYLKGARKVNGRFLCPTSVRLIRE